MSGALMKWAWAVEVLVELRIVVALGARLINGGNKILGQWRLRWPALEVS
jgi:hypothetical protein